MQLITQRVDEGGVIALLPLLLGGAHPPRMASTEEFDEGVLVLHLPLLAVVQGNIQEERIGLRGLQDEELGQVRVPRILAAWQVVVHQLGERRVVLFAVIVRDACEEPLRASRDGPDEDRVVGRGAFNGLRECFHVEGGAEAQQHLVFEK